MSSKHNPNETPTWLDPAPLPPEREDQVLADTKKQVWQQLQQKNIETQPVVSNTGSLWLRWAYPIAAIFTGAVVWWFLTTKPLPHIEFSPSTAGKLDKNAQLRSFAYNNPTKKSETLQVKGLWRLKASPKATMTLERSSARETRVKLHKGDIHVHVVPRTGQDFVVQSHFLKVVVMGTKFSVINRPSSLHVMVQKGFVQVRVQKDIYTLRKGQAQRFDRKDPKKVVLYRFPPPSLRSPRARAQWMWKHETMSFVTHLMDEIENPQLSQKEKARLTLEMTDYLARTKQWTSKQKVLLKLYRSIQRSQEQQLALFEAGSVCGQGKLPTQRCYKVWKLYLKLYPKGSFARKVREWLKR